MSGLLFEDQPLVVSPRLAAAVGLNEAIVLQQLHYWTQRSSNEHDGHRWVYNTTREWREQFPFWSESTIKRTLAGLREVGLIVVATSPHNAMDRTNWYRLDYEALDRVDDASGQNDPMGGSDCADGPGQSEPVSKGTETTTETSGREDAGAQEELLSSEGRPCPRSVVLPDGKRHRVTGEECTAAWQVMDAFNAVAGTRVRAKGFVEKILRRMHEHPELSVADHEAIIRGVLGGNRWWRGKPDPAIIYGSDEQFERCMAQRPSGPSGASVQSGAVQTGTTRDTGWDPGVENLDDLVRYD